MKGKLNSSISTTNNNNNDDNFSFLVLYYVYLWGETMLKAYMEVRGQPATIDSPLPPRGPWEQ